MLKKILTITTIVILGIIALIGGYFLVKKTAEIITGGNPPPTPSATAMPENIKIISDNPVFDYWAHIIPAAASSSAKTEYYYITPEGEILEANEKEDTPIATQPITDLQSITPNQDGSRILVAFGNINNPQFSILNIVDRSWQPLPTSVRAADFSPDGTQLALLSSTDGKNDLIIQDLTLQPKAKRLGSKTILSLYEKGLILRWPNQNQIILSDRPSAVILGATWQVDIKKATINSLASDANDSVIQWSKRGTEGIRYIIDQNQNPSISIIDNSGNVTNQLDIITFPDKCAFAENDLFCSTPNSLGTGSLQDILDTYLQKNAYFEDALYHLKRTAEGNYATQKITAYGRPIDAVHLTPENDKVFFINRLDQKLYSLDLSK